MATDGEVPTGEEEAVLSTTAWSASQAVAVSGGWPAAEPPG